MPPQPGTMRNRWTAYAALSASLAAGVILKSLAQRPNFYSAAVYLSQSSANLMILCNLVFVTACTFVLFLQKMLYGPLRPIEVEQLYEKAWFAVTETCLAMTIFRGEIGAWFLVMFFSLLAGKVWGWIGEGRVEVLEQQQHNILGGRSSRFFHLRLAASLALSVCFDLTMLEYVVGQVLHMARPDMMVMFGFEFAVLSITSLSTAVRYALNLIEIGIVQKQKQKRVAAIRKERVDAAIRAVEEDSTEQEGEESTDAQTTETDLAQRRTQAATAAASQPIDEAEVEVEGWEGKGRWVFYLDLITDFFKLVVYLSFFFILLIFYGLPLHIMRDVFLTCRSFFKRIGDFLRYRTATRDMNERYPDATETEIGREDVCIICREEMRPYVPPAQGTPTDPLAERMRPKKLPCGHVLHFSCLRSWLERQQICPTCRATVVPTPQTRQGPAGAAGTQPGAPRAPNQPNGGNGRPRVYQFGPLRIGVGAARGNNMFEDLEHQLANPDPQPPQAQNGNAPQQYGFGIRWDGIRRRGQDNRRRAQGSIEDQLNAAEQQIQRELDTLQSSMSELQALRQIQGQLASIRLARQGTNGQTVSQPTAQPLPQTNPQLRSGLPTITGLASNSGGNILQSGSDQLPQGLILPEGWTMMPLQPIQGSAIPGHTAFGPVPIPPQMAGAPQIPFIGQHGPTGQMLHNMTFPAVVRQGQEMMRAASTQANTTNDQQPSREQTPSLGFRVQQPTSAQNASQRPEPRQQSNTPAQNLPSIPRDSSSPLSESSSGFVRSSGLTTDGQLSHEPTSVQPRPTPSARPPQQPQRLTQISSPPSIPMRQASPQVTRAQSSSSASSPRLPPPTANASASSTSRITSTSNPPRQLNPTTVNGARTVSPHRPTRSIGSSWGFSGVEDADESESTTESEDDAEDQARVQAKAKGNATPSQNATRRATGASEHATARRKNPTVEDLVEDPD